MRFKGTIFLTFFLILLGFYLYWVELPNEEKKQETFLNKGKLFHFQLNEISRITIRSPKGEVELEYFPGHPSSPWRIFHPVETIADQIRADELANLIIGLKASRLVEAKPKELHEFGLDPAPYRVLVTINQTDTEIIELGSENLTGSDVYLRKGMGTSLYLVPAGIKELLNKGLEDWRQKEIFPFSPEAILSIKMFSPTEQMVFKKSTEGWSIERRATEEKEGDSLKVRGDTGEIANLLGGLLNFRGERFIDLKKREWQNIFGPPLLTVALQVQKVEREATFYKDGINPEIVYAVTPNNLDPIFQISASDFQAIKPSFETYRNKQLFSLEFPGQIEKFVIDFPEKNYTLYLDNEKWMVQAAGQAPKEVINVNRVSHFQTDMYHLTLDTFKDDIDPDSSHGGLNPPQHHISLLGKNDIVLGKLHFGRRNGDQIIAKSSSQPYPFLLHQNKLNLIPSPNAFTDQ